jgi:hypothetical protein
MRKGHTLLFFYSGAKFSKKPLGAYHETIPQLGDYCWFIDAVSTNMVYPSFWRNILWLT